MAATVVRREKERGESRLSLCLSLSLSLRVPPRSLSPPPPTINASSRSTSPTIPDSTQKNLNNQNRRPQALFVAALALGPPARRARPAARPRARGDAGQVGCQVRGRLPVRFEWNLVC